MDCDELPEACMYVYMYVSTYVLLIQLLKVRVCIYYNVMSCVTFQLSSIFIPYGVNAGASGAVFGLLGVLFVELFQFWQIVDRAWLELIKLLSFVVFLLALGTLPYVDNMSHVGMFTLHMLTWLPSHVNYMFQYAFTCMCAHVSFLLLNILPSILFWGKYSMLVLQTHPHQINWLSVIIY